MIARLTLAAALLGSAVGATAVLAADDEPPRHPAPPAVAVATATAVPTPEPIEVRDLRPVREVPDPEGGTPWGVRRFATPFKLRRKTVPNECWELGRIQGGEFGWIDRHGTFTAREAGRSQVPMVCRPLGRAKEPPRRFSTISYVPGSAPEASRTITWGIGADEAVRIEIDGEDPIAVPADRLYLRIEGSRRLGPLSGASVRSDGKRTRFGDVQLPGGAGGDRPVPGTERVAIRAPDPAGGEPWGVIVQRGRRGGVCFDIPERLIVGDQPGYIDPTLDVFMGGFFPFVRCAREAPTRGYPLRLDTLIAGTRPAADDRGRIERRVLDGRIIYWGRVHPDVVSVTLRTPRDVRTLIPTTDLHFVLAVYDGLFPGGKATATARMRDGREVTRSLHVE